MELHKLIKYVIIKNINFLLQKLSPNFFKKKSIVIQKYYYIKSYKELVLIKFVFIEKKFYKSITKTLNKISYNKFKNEILSD